ncbi:MULTISPECIES: hypothetical protein [unclassified Beijerinckia]|uniref:hypothetical protein n=1 Tax=unclassified Beijerinckia TaxID=2638183 RepID=UPI00089BBA80|nr:MULTISPECIES: hypothetical protein [unclassified Beijerinckia]MDH7798308.1 hypothetical protein [Beijerinckia sp. GAS462]SED16492.1 hypothetical protein SAMN05443249_4604 [Beijerinckia sp. 28-YEA-48]
MNDRDHRPEERPLVSKQATRRPPKSELDAPRGERLETPELPLQGGFLYMKMEVSGANQLAAEISPGANA